MEQIKDPWESSRKSNSILNDFNFQPNRDNYDHKYFEEESQALKFSEEQKKQKELIDYDDLVSIIKEIADDYYKIDSNLKKTDLVQLGFEGYELAKIKYDKSRGDFKIYCKYIISEKINNFIKEYYLENTEWQPNNPYVDEIPDIYDLLHFGFSKFCEITNKYSEKITNKVYKNYYEWKIKR